MNQEEENIFSLSKVDTSALKGIAILAMLCHHMYGYPPEGVDPYSGIQLWLGVLGKVCVALFLFCSGYGMAKQYSLLPHNTNIGVQLLGDARFLLKRLIKFYANYWVIFLIFVPIGVFIFNHPLSAAYGENVNVAKRLIYDFMGIQGYKSYNITWWFNQLILWMYLCFPLFYRVASFRRWIILIFSVVIVPFSIRLPYVPPQICAYQFPFILGIVWAMSEDKFSRFQESYYRHKYLYNAVVIGLLCVCILIRQYSTNPYFEGIRLDGFLTLSIVLFYVFFLKYDSALKIIMEFLGKHSVNIYLVHTFFNEHWFSRWLHASEWMRGGGNFILLTIICLLISIGIEFLKEKIRLYEFVNYIAKRI